MNWHTLEHFALPRSERDLYYARVSDTWTLYGKIMVLGIPTTAVYAYLEGLWKEGGGHERQLMWCMAEEECNMMSLGALFRLVPYGAVRRISDESMMARCEWYGSLLRFSLEMVDERIWLRIQRLERNVNVDPVFALGAMALVTELDWATLSNQESF